jgi:hypothetical protein
VNKKISFYIDEDVLRGLKASAEYENTTIQWVMREATRLYMLTTMDKWIEEKMALIKQKEAEIEAKKKAEAEKKAAEVATKPDSAEPDNVEPVSVEPVSVEPVSVEPVSDDAKPLENTKAPETETAAAA